MILVIICHAASFWTGNWFTNNPVNTSIHLVHFAIWIGSFHTYAFTLVSGYIFAYIISGGGTKSMLSISTKK